MTISNNNLEQFSFSTTLFLFEISSSKITNLDSFPIESLFLFTFIIVALSLLFPKEICILVFSSLISRILLVQLGCQHSGFKVFSDLKPNYGNTSCSLFLSFLGYPSGCSLFLLSPMLLLSSASFHSCQLRCVFSNICCCYEHRHHIESKPT